MFYLALVGISVIKKNSIKEKQLFLNPLSELFLVRLGRDVDLRKTSELVLNSPTRAVAR